MSSSLVLLNQTALKEELKEFAIRVNREVCIRVGAFSPDNPEESRQLSEGPVKVGNLDTVRDYLFKQGG